MGVVGAVWLAGAVVYVVSNVVWLAIRLVAQRARSD